MCELAESTDAFTFKCLKNKLKEKYREQIFFQRLMAALILCVLSYLVYEKWYTERKTNTANKPKRIIQTAPKIIMNDMHW